MKFTFFNCTLFGSALFLISIHSIFGDEVTFVTESGKPVSTLFSDGRTAQLQIDRKPLLQLKVPFKVSDNDCAPGVEMSCEYHTTIGLDTFILQWTTNSDAPKIGQPLSFTIRGDTGATSFPLRFVNIYGVGERRTSPQIARTIPDDEIICSDYSWIPGATTDAPDRAIFERIDVEGMFQNPETGINENRTLGGMVGVTLKKNPAGNLSLVDVKNYSAISLSILNANVWSFVAKDSTGNFCPISTKPDITNSSAPFLQYFGSAPHLTPYLFDSDEYSSTDRMAVLKSTLSNPIYEFH